MYEYCALELLVSGPVLYIRLAREEKRFSVIDSDLSKEHARKYRLKIIYLI
ncbi:MAG: hypothetical protein K0R50_4032 [Eubacterium sp.]|jgi:hypothetical protein|nr:hypothetical protein [Eubacterium sp.]